MQTADLDASGGSGNLKGNDSVSYYRIGRPLIASDGFQRHEPWAEEVLITFGACGSGYVLTSGHNSCHFDTFQEIYDSAWVLNYFAHRAVFIHSALEHKLAGVR